MAQHSTYEDWSDSKKTSVAEGALQCENMLYIKTVSMQTYYCTYLLVATDQLTSR